ncbi:MAG: hypothetical protein HZA91_09340 [Verrucomicrobia bacterium]|nr:hypothetical protein [Verrucomicrobiota bacterium]
MMGLATVVTWAALSWVLSAQQPVSPPGSGANPAVLVHVLHAKIKNLIRLQRYDEAEAAVMDLVQRDRNSAQYAQQYLREIHTGRAALEAPLRQIILPDVDFRDAALPDVVKFLGDMSAAHAPNKRPVSFILQLPPGAAVPRVTLNLHHVPLLDVLRYAISVAGLEFRVEPHAVVIYKPQPAAPAAPAGTGGGAPPAPVP